MLEPPRSPLNNLYKGLQTFAYEQFESEFSLAEFSDWILYPRTLQPF